jgi:hypothetical protein
MPSFGACAVDNHLKAADRSGSRWRVLEDEIAPAQQNAADCK